MMDALQQQLNANLPFVSYRKPNENRIKSVFQQDERLHTVKDFTEEGFVFAPFDNKKESLLIPFEKVTETLFTPKTVAKNSIKHVVNSVSKKQHINLVANGIEAIQTGTYQKIVLSRKQEVSRVNNNAIELFERLLSLYTNAFVYVWYHPKVGCWLGATPETLLHVKGNNFKTMSLAGTQTYQENIGWGAKDTEEQQMVTDYVSNCLQQENISYTVGDLRTVKAGNLAHLCTEVNGRLSNVSIGKLISILHPTPAVCGLPKQQSKDFILNNEGYDRSFYTGYLGELNSTIARKNNRRNVENHAYNFDVKSSNLFVNLRCMQLHKNSVSIYVGGGITADSDPNLEYQETVNKAKTMLTALGL